MNIKDLILKKVLYYMQSFVINANGTEFSVPRTEIINIDIDKQYDSMIYPLWYISVNVPNWFYTIITQNTENITVSMNLQYVLAEDQDKLTINNTYATTEVSGKFKAVVPYTTQFGDSTIQKNISKENKTYKKNYEYNEYAYIELALYNINAYKASFNTINAVLGNCNVSDIITWCFNKFNIKNILLARSDNNRRYSEFKILPQTGTKNMMRVIDEYGFHNNGSVLFFDIDRSYLVPKRPGCFAWGNNENKTTHILSLSEFDNITGVANGVYLDNVEKYNAMVISRDSFTTQNLDGAPLISETGETNFLQINTKQSLISILTPNKEFIVNIDSKDAKKYNGKYRIRTMSCTMTSKGEFLDPTFTIMLRR